MWWFSKLIWPIKIETKDMNNLNRIRESNESEAVMTSLPTKKGPVMADILLSSTNPLRGRSNTNSSQIVPHKTERWGATAFYKPLYLRKKPHKNKTKTNSNNKVKKSTTDQSPWWTLVQNFSINYLQTTFKITCTGLGRWCWQTAWDSGFSSQNLPKKPSMLVQGCKPQPALVETREKSETGNSLKLTGQPF